jgi:hypothetical protein
MQKNFLLFLALAAFMPGTAQTAASDLHDPVIVMEGGWVRLTSFGFPEQIATSVPADSLLAENIHFHFTRQSDGKDIRLKSEGVEFTKRDAKATEWKAVASSDELKIIVEASLNKAGRLAYSVQVEVLADLDVKDITMHIPFRKEMAGYMRGLGKKFGIRSDSMYNWKWGAAFGESQQVWIGTPATGLQYTLAGAPEWTNQGKGGIDIGIKGKSMLANNYSGPRHLQKGDTLRYSFILLITPGE